MSECWESLGLDLVLVQEPGANCAKSYSGTEYVLHRGAVDEAPAILVRKRLDHRILHAKSSRYWFVAIVELQGILFCCCSVHLPDHGSLSKLGLNLRSLLKDLHSELEILMDFYALEVHFAFRGL